MTLKTALRLACSIAACVAARAQIPTPEQAVKVVSVTAGPDTVSTVTVHVHNASGKDITHLSGMLTYTPYGLPPIQTRCSTSLLENWVYATKPRLKGFTRYDNQKKPREKGTLNQGENLDVQCGIQPPTKIEQGTATFTPDTVIFSDQTWSGDQRTAQDAFRERKRIAGEYGKVGVAVQSAEHSPDPIKRYEEILAEWLPQTGITTTAAGVQQVRATKQFPTLAPYYRLQAYLAVHQSALREQAAQAARGVKADLQALTKARIDQMLLLDSTIGAEFHIHSEAK